MSLTLGLNTAISGMMTNQRGLDVVAQNVANTNTVGYTRKTMNQEAVVLAGHGSGVQVGSITRDIDEGLLKSLRRETTKLSEYDTANGYYDRLNQLFGPPSDNTSVSHAVTALSDSVESMVSQVTKQTSYLGVAQASKELTDRLNDTSAQIQQLRADADLRVGDVVGLINEQLASVENLNNLIVKNTATGSGVEDLQDKRDQALTNLAGYMEVSYYKNSDGSVTVFSGSNMLVDRRAATLAHTTVSNFSAESSGGDGTVDGIWLDGRDISKEVKGGELGSLLHIRDSMLSDVQAGLDQLAAAMATQINAASNRGTAFPSPSSTMTGTRAFADQGNVTQKIQLGGATDDVYMNLFDSNGAQITGLNLDQVMTTDYSGGAGGDAGAKASRGSWSVDEVAAHIQGWLRASGTTYSLPGVAANATVGLDATGHMAIDVGDSAITLAFRDQTSGVAGAPPADAAINFDVNGDGNSDQTTQGFSNFFGFNDMFVTGRPNFLKESQVQPVGTKLSQPRTIGIYDPSGLLGNSITLPAGATLDTIASTINKVTATHDSGVLDSTYTVPASLNGLQMTIAGPSGPLGSYTAKTGDTLATMQASIASMGLNASLVQDGSGQRLRFSDATGRELTTSGDMAAALGIQERHLVKASVVSEGSGVRLRISQNDRAELFISATTDVNGKSLLTDLNIGNGSTGTSEDITLRQDLQNAPHTMPRGAVQFNAANSTYYLDEGDNTTAQQMVTALTDKIAVPQTGKLGAGNFTLAEYGANVVGMASREADGNKSLLAYQTQLKQSIQTQYAGKSGVNMDEEMTKMISYQQAYAATAKVITTLQDMLEVLTSMIR